MGWINIVVIKIFIMAMSGGAASLIWGAACCVLQRYGKTGMIYTLLKCVILGYLLPVTVSLKCYGTDEYKKTGSGILFGIWCAGIAVSTIIQLLRQSRLKRSFKAKIPVRQEEYILLEELRQKMGIRKKVHIYKCYGVLSPCIYGTWKSGIFLPVMPFKKEQLEMIFYHELTHLRRQDLIWKRIFVLLRIIFWFNPFSWVMLEKICSWAEASCDEICCRRYPARLYFEMMSDLLIEAGSKAPIYTFQYSKGAEEFCWRAGCIIKNSERSG